ncbi:NUDIX domain-containing protein [Synechococcus sp. PCC 7336]|uniref:NUDIX domain-containing protein n=1 Tax=Synechococcus sp. PCC 7336 TaxID=195250 RepID=UPI000360C571|nr:NUDIX hydrolase [Synechococcus sp. PCC 7336]
MFQLWRFGRTLLRLLLRRPLVGTSIIPILGDGRIVLVRRRDTRQWSLPGGLVDWGETIETAARRELVEETGLELTQVRRLVGVYSSTDRDPRMHSVCIAIAADACGQFSISDTAEIVEVQAFELSKLPLGYLAHDHDRQLSDFFAHRTKLS